MRRFPPIDLPTAIALRYLSSFTTVSMRIFLKSFLFSLKSTSFQPGRLAAMPSGVLPPAEMRRLVADMVD